MTHRRSRRQVPFDLVDRLADVARRLTETPPCLETRIVQVQTLEERLLLNGAPADAAAVQPVDSTLLVEGLESSAVQKDGEGTGDSLESVIRAVQDAYAETQLPNSEAAREESSGDRAEDASRRSEVVFLDRSVDGWQQILDDLWSDQQEDRELDVVLLSTSRDGIAQISDALASRSGVDAVHIISHGTGGEVQLGSTRLTNESFSQFAVEIAGWGSALSDDADLLLYGCDLAATDDGRSLVEKLGTLCDCDVAASTDVTGHVSLDGDWDLEFVDGQIETSLAVSDDLIAGWIDTLDITSNLFAHYEFEENGGGTATDSTANNNDGSWTDAPSWNNDAAVGGFSLDFTGDATNSNAFVSVPNDASLDFGDDFTISFWFNASVSQTDGATLFRAHDGFEGTAITANADGTLNWLIDDGGTDYDVGVSGFVADGNWHHAAVTWNDGTERRVIYIDGVEQYADNVVAIGTVNPSGGIHIGAESSTTGDYEGLLDEVRVYNRELNSGDIAELYLEGPSAITVTTTNDTVDGNTSNVASLLASQGADGSISLREAILAVNNDSAGHTIELAAGTYTLTAGAGDSLGDLDLRQSVTITGADSASTTIDANAGDRVLDVLSGTLVLQDVTITDGVGSGAGLNIASGATANVERVVVSNNTASSVSGGGIRNAGTLVMDDAVVSGNNANSASGGGLHNSGIATITNALFVGNGASSGSGGGIQNTAAGILNLTNVTISGNTASAGGPGGLNNAGVGSLTNVTITNNSNGGFSSSNGLFGVTNSIIAGNSGGDASGSYVDGGSNIIGTTAGLNLAALADNGGFSQTHALLAGSVAINAGTNSGAPSDDQRGVTRDGSVDIGSYEYVAPTNTITVNTTSDVLSGDADTSSITALIATPGSDGVISLREAIAATNNQAGLDTIQFEITDALDGDGLHRITLASALPVIHDAVTIDATTDADFGTTPIIVLDGNDTVDDGFELAFDSDGSTVRGFIIQNFAANGIQINGQSDGHTIVGNWIGSFDAAGSDAGDAFENVGYGVYVAGANNVVGGTTAADRNVLSGNNRGVVLNGVDATGNHVLGNYIGSDVTGNVAIGNVDSGVTVDNGASSNIIGTDSDASDDALEGNVIVGSGNNGVQFWGSTGNTLAGNSIGIGADGTTILGNATQGVQLGGSASSNTIGGTAANAGNVIGGNAFAGIQILGAGTDHNDVFGNFIGTDATGAIDLGNGSIGVLVNDGAQDNAIGGIAASQGNTIAFQADDGVSVFEAGSTGNTIRGNRIYGNDDLGIDLGDLTLEGETDNDAGDGDTGGNNIQNWAVVKAASIADDGTFAFEIDTTTLAAGTYSVDFYASSDGNLGDNAAGDQAQGERYLFSATGIANGNAAFIANAPFITATAGEFVTATVTDAAGSTSEFSNAVVLTDADADGATPSDLRVASTTSGGLTINSDGGNDTYLQADDGGAILGGLTDFTLEARVALGPAPPSFPHIIDYAVAGEDRELSLLLSGNTVRVTIADNSVGFAGTYPELRDGDPHTITVTKSAGGVLKLYIDGDYKEELTGVNSGYILATGGELVIGNDLDDFEGFSTSQYVEGTLHDIRIFGDVRTDTEVAANYRTELPRTEDNLIANWKFDQLSADGVVTESVAGNNLTVKHTAESGFTPSVPALLLSVDEDAGNGQVVGTVAGVDAERDALIGALLAGDVDLRYSAETNRFYKVVGGTQLWGSARTAAESTSLNGVNGQLATIRSAFENELVRELVDTTIGYDAWIGGTDSAVEGEWRWVDGGAEADQFWQGDETGSNTPGAYHNFASGQPNDGGGNEDVLHIDETTGLWSDADHDTHNFYGYVIEWYADDVLDANQALTYTITSQTEAGAFAIDADTGEVTVADGSLLDAVTDPTHTLSIQVTDADGNLRAENFSVALNTTRPTDIANGVSLNKNGGNDAFFAATDADFLLGASGHTYEVTFSGLSAPTGKATFYSHRDPGNAQSYFAVHADGTLDWAGVTTTGTYTQLFDGGLHTLALTWDAASGDINFYVDGSHAESLSVAPQAGSTGGPTFVLGQHVDFAAGTMDPDEAFRGTLHDFRVWDSARSAIEIAASEGHLFDASNIPTGLLANWRMTGLEGGGNDTLVDLVNPGGNDLTLQHAVGAGFTAGTASDRLSVVEFALPGSRVGYVIAADPDLGETLTYSLTDNAGGRFTIDSATGEITVANGSLLDFESATSNNITVRATDAAGGTYDEIIGVVVTDSPGDNVAPTGLSSGIELNTDGGNDAFLQANDGGAILGGLTSLTFETRFAIDSTSDMTTLVSYAASDPGGNDFKLHIQNTGANAGRFNAFIGSTNIATDGIDFTSLNDGQIHSLAFSWDNTNGQWAVYVDGEYVDSGTGEAVGAVIPGGGTLLFGQEQDSVGGGFQTIEQSQGTLYDVRIWDDVRSEAEIALNYQQKLDVTPVEAAVIGLVANWQMDGFDGLNQVVDIVSGNNLSIGHASGTGFTTSTPVEDLHVAENAANGTSVGYVVPTDPDVINDVVSDGLFLHAGATGYQNVGTGQRIGGVGGSWQVDSGDVDLEGAWSSSPLGGTALGLDGTVPGAISQTVATEAGRQYQVVFALTGNFQGGTTLTEMRAAAAGQSQDFSVTVPNGWSTSNLLWEERSFTFEADGPTTSLQFRSLSESGGFGAVIGDVQVVEIPQAVSSILNNDPTLSYDAATGKFYRLVASTEQPLTAINNATSATLNGVSGQLAVVRSAYENEILRDFAIAAGGDVYLGGRDATTEGDWHFLDGSDENEKFSTGSTAETGYFTNWGTGQPNGGLTENQLAIDTSGHWLDVPDSQFRSYVVEWDANEVLSSFTFQLTDDAGGRFAIDASTGEITVADGSLLDFESSTSHDITVEVTDAAGAMLSQTVTVVVNDVLDSPAISAPATLSVNQDGSETFSAAGGNAITFSDVTDSKTLTATLSVGNGTLTLGGTTGITFLNGTADGSATLTISGSQADINTALDGLVYTPTADYNGGDTLTISTGSAKAVETNLYASYEFESGATTDQSGNGLDGVVSGDPTGANDVERGDVMTFDGNDRVIVNNSVLGLGDEVTFAAWVNLDAGQQENVFLSIGDEFYVTLDRTNASYSMAVHTRTFTSNSLDAADNIAGEGWNHVAATFDDIDKQLHLYLNGELVRSTSFAFSDVDWGTAASPNITIGALSDGTNAFVGSLDDVRIYDTELTQAQIVEVMGDHGVATESVTITVLPDGVSQTLPAAQNVNEDASLTFSSAGGNAITVDDGTAATDTRLQVWLGVQGFNGTITLSQTTGLSFPGGSNGSSSMVIWGTEADINAALEGAVFTPDSDYNGPANITVETKFAADLEGHYQFENSGNVGQDTSVGLLQNGTTNGVGTPPGATVVVDGIRGNVLSLDGVDDSIEIASTFGTPASMTIGAWVNFADNGSRQELISIDNRVHIALDDGGSNTKGSIQTAPGVWVDLNSNQKLGGTGWRHVMYVFDDAADLHKLYIDGAEAASAVVVDSIDWAGATTTYIGQHPSNPTWLDGFVDDARIYTRALSANEVATLAADTGEASGAIALTVNAVNDAPTVGGSSLATINEDDADPPGDTVANLFGGSFADPDSGSSMSGIAVTSNNAPLTEGVWQYSTDGGTNWFDIGAVDSNNSVALSASTRVRFLPADDFDGPATIISLRALDDTYAGGFSTGATRVTTDTTSPGGSSPISSSLVSLSHTVTGENDAAVIATNNLLTVSEGSTGNVIGTSLLNEGDPDDDGADLFYRLDTDVTNGTLRRLGVALVSGNTFTQEDIDLSRITYDHDGSSTTADSFDFSLNDGGEDGTTPVSGTFNISITAVNDAPVITSGPGGGTYNEGGSGTYFHNGLTLTDSDSADFDGGTITVTITAAGEANDRLVVRDGNNVSMSGSNVQYDFGSGPITIGTVAGGSGLTPLVVTFNTNSTLASVEAVAQQIAFRSVSDTPSTTQRSLSMTITDGDGGTSNTANRVMNVVAVNDAPTFGNLTGGTANFTEGGPAVVLDSDVQILDAELNALDSFGGATLTLERSSGANADDVFSATGTITAFIEGNDIVMSGVTIGALDTNSGGTLLVSFYSDATGNLVNEFVRQLAYSNASVAPPGSVQIDWTFDDGNSGAQGIGTTGSVTGSTTVTINATNSAPSITPVSNQSINEDNTTGPLAFSVNDAETPVGSLIVTATSSNQTVLPDANLALTGLGGGNWTIEATPAADQNGGPVTITLTVDDGTDTTQTTFDVTVTAINDDPVVDLNGTDGVGLNFSATFAEGGGAIAAIDTDARVSDVDHTTHLGVGINLAGFVDGTDEELIVGVHTFQFGVSDVVSRTVGTTTLDIDFDGSGFSISRFGGGVIPVADVQLLLRGVQYNHASADPTAGVRTLTVQVTDAAGANSANAVSSITVTPANNPPTLTGFGDAVGVTTEDTEVEIDLAAVLAAGDEGDVDGSVTSFRVTSIASGSLRLGADAASATAFAAGTNEHIDAATRAYWTPSVDSNGILNAFSVVAVDDANAESTTPVVASVIVTAVNDAPTITAIGDQTINEDGSTGPLGFTVGDVESAAGVLTITATSSNTTIIPNGNLTLVDLGGGNWTIEAAPATDQSGGPVAITVAVGDGAATTQATFNVTVTSSNDAPTITPIGDVTILEDGTTGPLGFSVADIETTAAGLTVTAASSNQTLIADADLTLVDLGGGGWAIEARPRANESGTAAISISVSDGVATTTTDFLVTVTAVNDAPTALSLAGTSINENAAVGAMVGTATSADPDTGDSATYSITNDAGGRFVVDPTSGAITFTGAAPLDFETAASFAITLRVTDGAGATRDQNFTISVNDINEAPTGLDSSFQTAAIGEIVFGIPGIAGLADAAIDPEGDVLSAVLETDVTNGALTFDSAGAFTYVPDATFDGVDSFTYRVTDGTNLSAPITVSILVEPLAPAPPPTTGLDPNLDAPNGSDDADSSDGGGEDSSSDSSDDTEDEADSEESANEASTSDTSNDSENAQETTEADTATAESTPTPEVVDISGQDVVVTPISELIEESTEAQSETTQQIGAPPQERTRAALFDRESATRDELERASLRSLERLKLFRNISVENSVSVVPLRFSADDGRWEAVDSEAPPVISEELVIGSTKVVSASLTVGYVVWVVRGGTLVASLVASLPAWASFDPLAVVSAVESTGGFIDDGGESLSDLVNSNNTPDPDRSTRT